MLEFILASSDQEYEAASFMFREYAADIHIDLSFQHFDQELNELRIMYGAANGGIILCIAELKRMYTQPEFRRKGIGKVLLEKAIALAKDLNYEKIRLDTLDYMLPAIKLYEEYGFKKIEPYYFNPISTAVFFEKNL